jgi:hypothetical protein
MFPVAPVLAGLRERACKPNPEVPPSIKQNLEPAQAQYQ